nr:hypothetical protein [Peterkaempfera bronchialis]
MLVTVRFRPFPARGGCRLAGPGLAQCRAPLGAVQAAQIDGGVFGDHDVHVVGGGADRGAQRLDQGGAAAVPAGQGDDAEPARGAGRGGHVVGLTADARDRLAAHRLDVDLAVQVDLEGGVDRGQRRPRGEPARMVGVFQGMDQGPAVGPVVELLAAGQVGRDGQPPEQSAAVQGQHVGGDYSGVHMDRAAQGGDERRAHAARRELDAAAVWDERGDAFADDALDVARAAAPVDGCRAVRPRVQLHDAGGVQQRPGMGGAGAVLRYAGDHGARLDGGVQPGRLHGEPPSAGDPHHRCDQHVGPDHVAQQRGDRAQPCGQIADGAVGDGAAQRVSGHDGAHLGEGREVEALRRGGAPAEEQPYPARFGGGPGELVGGGAARQAGAVRERHGATGSHELVQSGHPRVIPGPWRGC